MIYLCNKWDNLRSLTLSVGFVLIIMAVITKTCDPFWLLIEFMVDRSSKICETFQASTKGSTIDDNFNYR